MATTTAAITLTSNDLLTNSLSLNTTQTLYNDPAYTTGLQRLKVQATAVHATATVLYTADDFAAGAYLYIKNTHATSTEYLWVYEDTNDRVLLKMAGGDWAFMPLKGDTTIKAYAPSGNNPTVEFMVIGTDQ